MDLTEEEKSGVESVALKAKLLNDFYFFARYVFFRMTGNKWVRNWHHETICNALQRVYNGDCRRLIINIPPRYSKTMLVVEYFSAWCFAKAGDCNFLSTSFSAELAAKSSVNARNILIQEWFTELFDISIDKTFASQSYWKTTSGGEFYAVGAGGTITGFGAGKKRDTFGGCVLVDDPQKPNDIYSDKLRESVIEWFKSTLFTRLNNPKKTPIIVIMQRLHEEDLSGWLLNGGTGEEWEHICLPIVNEQGEPLWPFMHDLPEIEVLKKFPQTFAGQYLQKPAPIEGDIFKMQWWRFYEEHETPNFVRIIHSWDTAFKTNNYNDPSSCTVWGVTSNNQFYLLDRINERLEYPDLKAKIKALHHKYWADAILVEDKASGQSLIQDLKREGGLPIVAIKVDSDKATRAFAVTGHIESGNVFLPSKAPWLTEYMSQLGHFPNGKHDDDVDSTTQALNYLNRRPALTASSLVGTYRGL